MEREQKYEHGSLTTSNNEHIAVMEQEIPVFENVEIENMSLAPMYHVGTRVSDFDFALEACQIDKPLTRYRSSIQYELQPYEEKQVTQPTIFLNDESDTTEEVYEIEATQVSRNFNIGFLYFLFL